jgi:hypothetical protein
VGAARRAIPVALLITVAVYLVVGVAALLAAGLDRLATSVAPLTTAVRAAGASTLAPVVRIGAALASLGALLALIAGIGRTSLAMARHRDLPSWLSAVHPRHRSHTTPNSPSPSWSAPWPPPRHVRGGSGWAQHRAGPAQTTHRRARLAHLLGRLAVGRDLPVVRDSLRL